LKARLLSVIRLKIDTLEPYHEYAGVLFQTAADPHSPLNPFAHAAAPVRDDSIKLFEDLVAETKARIPDDLRAELPYLLWLYHMGIILFWIHDTSRKRVRTYRLIDQTVDLLDKLISLASNPLMRPVRKKALRLVVELREDLTPGSSVEEKETERDESSNRGRLRSGRHGPGPRVSTTWR
jgi:hypothetical protein